MLNAFPVLIPLQQNNSFVMFGGFGEHLVSSLGQSTTPHNSDRGCSGSVRTSRDWSRSLEALCYVKVRERWGCIRTCPLSSHSDCPTFSVTVDQRSYPKLSETPSTAKRPGATFSSFLIVEACSFTH